MKLCRQKWNKITMQTKFNLLFYLILAMQFLPSYCSFHVFTCMKGRLLKSADTFNIIHAPSSDYIIYTKFSQELGFSTLSSSVQFYFFSLVTTTRHFTSLQSTLDIVIHSVWKFHPLIQILLLSLAFTHSSNHQSLHMPLHEATHSKT